MTTTPEHGPAALVLGAHLRSLRLAKGITATEAAQAIRSSESKLSRMETDQARHRWQDVSTLARLYGTTNWPSIATAVRWTKRRARRRPKPRDERRAAGHSAQAVRAAGQGPRVRRSVGGADAMTTASNDPAVAGTEWRAALEHAAGCPTCRALGVVCLEGEWLLRTHE
ncbi:helix-turn-helix domain-containing protein, partial [Streptomyces antioxidans]|uniref:helix-turn-helix domain-containing protein n=1 Tax=Streptomyces antioxidans TaxID=1507734 RepID=UPI00117F7F2B